MVGHRRQEERPQKQALYVARSGKNRELATKLAIYVADPGKNRQSATKHIGFCGPPANLLLHARSDTVLHHF